MARLHLNTFKVDATFPIDWSQGHAAAAAMLGGDAASAGSALYLLGSLFNHSCEPNVHVTFPGNDSTAVFIAARQIAAGEQLYITYIDAGQELDARQEYLAFAYGFRCETSSWWLMMQTHNGYTRGIVRQLQWNMSLMPGSAAGYVQCWWLVLCAESVSDV
jgi:hypothetical protein